MNFRTVTFSNGKPAIINFSQIVLVMPNPKGSGCDIYYGCGENEECLTIKDDFSDIENWLNR